ncbi:glycosyltransferase family 2 protein [Micrococcus luteus]|uniref:glycosyltransferase family 2 protein n=1 Tax=Micrococcus sp. KRD153 TaxID=2729724 RepID=UPI0019CF6DD4|nr:glycosyltransferase family A protein [Micrococcus sp. KRD153]MCV7455661.1 glycosyltransferase family 2 protein [Micrococcus luteus]MCV7555582.1 glycosyltransferase family 2 protein [Micrococcus luteus]
MTETPLTPEASVIVPSRGGAQRLPRLIGALAAQEDAPPFEVHVVVDGDVDGSEAVLAQVAAEHPGLDLSWTVFGENRGRVAALNAGADATSGRILIRADDDLEPGPHYIRDHVAAHDDGPRGVIGLTTNVLPETPFQRVYGDAQDEAHRRHAYALPAKQQWRHWAGNVSVPRALHEELGGYSADYRRYGWEDVDFGYRLHRAGYPVVIHPELETKHHAAAITTYSKARRALHSGSARQTFIAKHGADALGGNRAPGGPWGAAVRAVAALSTERTIQYSSAVIERAAAVLPAPIARKIIALQVEAAAEAGRVHPERARRTF